MIYSLPFGIGRFSFLQPQSSDILKWTSSSKDRASDLYLSGLSGDWQYNQIKEHTCKRHWSELHSPGFSWKWDAKLACLVVSWLIGCSCLPVFSRPWWDPVFMCHFIQAPSWPAIHILCKLCSAAVWGKASDRDVLAFIHVAAHASYLPDLRWFRYTNWWGIC